MEVQETLNPQTTALVVIDLQNGIVAHSGRVPYTGAQVVEKAAKLAEAFAARGAFVALARASSVDGKDRLTPKTDLQPGEFHSPEGWDRLVPELERIPNTHVVAKRQWGAFYGTDLDLQLRRRGIDTIVLCGISTAYGVDTTAREAYQRGYHQIFVEDAMAASLLEEHEYVCRNIFPKIGKIRSAEQVIELLK